MNHINTSGEPLFLFKENRFILDPEVIPPHFGSLLLADHVSHYIDKGNLVLDLGTGTGFLGIIAAKKARRVIATDISYQSAICTRKNAVLNKVDKKIMVFVGDMFSGLKQSIFDLIIGNVPMMPIPPRMFLDDPLSTARNGGIDGRFFMDKMILKGSYYLKPRAKLLFQQFDFLDIKKTIKMMERSGFITEIIDEKVQDLSQPGVERLEYLKKLSSDSLIHEKTDIPRCKRYVILGIKKNEA